MAKSHVVGWSATQHWQGEAFFLALRQGWTCRPSIYAPTFCVTRDRRADVRTCCPVAVRDRCPRWRDEPEPGLSETYDRISSAIWLRFPWKSRAGSLSVSLA